MKDYPSGERVVLLTNDGGCQEPDRLIWVVTVRKEWLDHVVGERQSHDSVGGWSTGKQICRHCFNV